MCACVVTRAVQESWLHFGDPEGGWVGMEWSETQPIGLTGRSGAYSYPYAFHTFEIYHPSLCGADLLSNYSSHWTAMVDTGATCLSLPQVCSLTIFASVRMRTRTCKSVCKVALQVVLSSPHVRKVCVSGTRRGMYIHSGRKSRSFFLF